MKDKIKLNQQEKANYKKQKKTKSLMKRKICKENNVQNLFGSGKNE